jgi:mono/diheme cytochrome c family protein
MKMNRCFLFVSLMGICLCLACSTRKPVAANRPAPSTPPPVAATPPPPPVPTPVVATPPPPPAPSAVVASKPVAAPPQPSNVPLPASVLTWDSELKTIEVHEGEPQGHLAFSFTNVSPQDVIILNVHPGCGCTTAQLPPLPWTNAPGASGQIGVTINVHGTVPLFKNLTVTTDKGIKTLNFRVNILPVVVPQLTEADRARDLQIALTNRQAVLQGECVICHVKQGEGKYGKSLYDADCGICHDGPHRAALVPDLHVLKAAANLEYWRTWITHGKPGSLMPAFASSEGGPLNDMQIALLAQYLNGLTPPQPRPAIAPLPPAAQPKTP